MESKLWLLFVILFLSVSCSADYSPKPRGYFYIDLPQPVYRDFDNYPYFRCSISNQTVLKEVKEVQNKNETGFNLIYPRLHAQIYCTYYKTNKEDLPVLSEECRRLAYIQEEKAKGVTETPYNNPEEKVYALVYEMQGDAASPIQFVITDSVRYFFRGALYFDTTYNRDSITPALAYVNQDIHVIIESFQWKQ